MSRPVTSESGEPNIRRALALLRTSAAADDQGYVHLQTVPYRGHHLAVTAVLDATEPGDRVFEGGVSSGYFASVLVRAGLRVDGHELDPEMAGRARKVCGEVHVGDLSRFEPVGLDGAYDVLLFADTLEHLPDPPAVLRRLRPMLRPDGALIVSVPNIANWMMRLSLLAGRFDYAERGIMDRTHLRFYTVRTLTGMLAEAGFGVESIVGSIPVPGVTGETLARVTHRIGNLRPSVFAYGLIVTARPVQAIMPRR